MLKVEIDEGSGFCFGVTTAIRKTEEELAKSDTLYCLGDIVHNGRECERLKQLGLNTIDHEEFARLKNTKVLLQKSVWMSIIPRYCRKIKQALLRQKRMPEER